MVGATLIVWPEVTQTLFREPAFVGHEQALIRVIGLTVVVIGWLYFFGGLGFAAAHVSLLKPENYRVSTGKILLLKSRIVATNRPANDGSTFDTQLA